MTDEKTPPQRVAAKAQIVIDINTNGVSGMVAPCWGTPDSSYGGMSNERFFKELAKVMAELQQQLAIGRRLTISESAALKPA